MAELIRNTDETHPDWTALCKADEIVSAVARHINEQVRVNENRQKLLDVQREFSDEVNFVAPHRSFVRRGKLVKKNRASDTEYEFILFSDMLLYASSTFGTGKLKVIFFNFSWGGLGRD